MDFRMKMFGGSGMRGKQIYVDNMKKRLIKNKTPGRYYFVSLKGDDEIVEDGILRKVPKKSISLSEFSIRELENSLFTHECTSFTPSQIEQIKKDADRHSKIILGNFQPEKKPKE